MDRTSLALVLAAALAGCGTSSSGGGAGGGDAGGPPAEATTSTTSGGGDGTGGSGGGGEAYPLDCTAFPRCAGPLDEGELQTQCADGEHCIAYPGCLTPIPCITRDEACAAYCGPGYCDVNLSAPAQMDFCAAEIPGVDAITCEDIRAELDVIQACTGDEQCGRVLPGTSCGCTRNLVARNDVPVDVFEAMLPSTPDECAFGSTCDCPETDGFACVDGRCTWNYVDQP